MAIYMKFGDIKGQTTTEGFKDWIELTSFQLGVGRGVTSGAGGKQREGSNPSISEVTVTKPFDIASPKLYEDALGGTFESTVQIKFTTTTKDKVESRVLWNVAVGSPIVVLEMPVDSGEPPLARGDGLLVLDLLLKVMNRFWRLVLKSDGLSNVGLYR